MTNILIVEDHDILAETLKNMLGDSFNVVGVVKDSKLALLHCQKFNPDLVLMDILTSNNSSGIDACNEIKAKYDNIKVLFITGFDGSGYIKRAMLAKADGYITKDKSKEEILEAINMVLNGKTIFPPIEEAESDNELTRKEQEVLLYVCEGLTRSEIAEKMFISEATVKTHLRNLFSKTNTRNRTELAIHAVTNGYVKNVKKN